MVDVRRNGAQQQRASRPMLTAPSRVPSERNTAAAVAADATTVAGGLDMDLGEAVMVVETGDGRNSDEETGEGRQSSTAVRHTFSNNAPARRSTLNVFSSAAAEEAGLSAAVRANAARARRSSMAALTTMSVQQHPEHMI